MIIVINPSFLSWKARSCVAEWAWGIILFFSKKRFLSGGFVTLREVQESPNFGKWKFMAKTIICYHQFLATNAMLPHDVRSIVFLVTMSFFLHIQPKSSCNHMNANFPDPTFFRNFRNYKIFLLFFSAFMYAFKICCL